MNIFGQVALSNIVIEKITQSPRICSSDKDMGIIFKVQEVIEIVSFPLKMPLHLNI
jgi:hypothetical protein